MARPPRIPITRLLLGEEEAGALSQVLASGWLGMGPRTAEFEARLAAQVEAAHAVAVSSGTAALELSLRAAGLEAGAEVILPALTFAACAHAVVHAGYSPVLVEVEAGSFNIDPAAVRAAIGPRTGALMVVHQLGLPAALDELRALAEQQGLLLLEDAACALGASYRGAPIGKASRLCCFSFHPRKVITTGEGGMICTDDEPLAERLRLLRNQGISLPAAERHQAGAIAFEELQEIGFNHRLTDLQAAVGLQQLRRLPGLLAARRRLAERYREKLLGLPLQLPLEPAGSRHSYQSFMVLLPEGICRRRLMEQLLARGIDSRRGLTALHRTPAYRERFPALRLPVSEALARRGLILPLYPQMTEEEQDRVVAALSQALA